MIDSEAPNEAEQLLAQLLTPATIKPKNQLQNGLSVYWDRQASKKNTFNNCRS